MIIESFSWDSFTSIDFFPLPRTAFYTVVCFSHSPDNFISLPVSQRQLQGTKAGNVQQLAYEVIRSHRKTLKNALQVDTSL